MKKVFGVIYVLLFALSLYGSIVNGSLFSDRGSSAANSGYLLGLIFGFCSYIVMGILFFVVDFSAKASLLKCFYTRKFLLIPAIPVAIYFTLALIATAFFTIITGESILSFPMLLACFNEIVVVNFIIFYISSNLSSKKLFKNLNVEQLVNYSEIHPINKNGSVLANEKVIIFKTLAVILPIELIQTYEDKSIRIGSFAIDPAIHFTTSDNKKIKVYSGECDAIDKFFESLKEESTAQ